MTIIHIEKDATRLLNHWFLQAIPMKKGTLHAGGKYTVQHPEYGDMGTVECTHLYTKMLHELKPVELMMMGDMDYVKNCIEQQRMFKVDTVQVCTFKFIRRNTTSFDKLIRTEAHKKGFPLVEARTLFDTEEAA